MGKTLYYFTASFPYGLGEQWKVNELNELVHYFDDIVVVPYSYSGNKTSPKSVPKGVKVQDPLFEDASLQISRLQLLEILFHTKVYIFLSEFFKKKVFLKKKWLIGWITATQNAIRLFKHPFFITLQKTDTHNTILYFYWGKGSSEILPFIKTELFDKVVVRFHGYDLFEYRNHGYIPYRKQLLDCITCASPVSTAGQKHLISLYPRVKAEINVFRCGTIDNGKKTKASKDGVLRVVSCSSVIPLKRIHVMIEAVRQFEYPLEWTHVGDGPLMDQFKNLLKEYGLEDKFIFIGWIAPDKILDYYTERQFDVFVNTSSTEGVPVSVMEAFATSIPVLATDVGGTGEILDRQVGRLMPADLTPELLVETLIEFYNLPGDQKNEMKENAFHRYMEKCNARELAKELAQYLVS